MMLDYTYSISAPVQDGELYRYCKDEDLDYLYTVTKIKKERRKTKRRPVFIRSAHGKRERKTEICGQGCSRNLN